MNYWIFLFILLSSVAFYNPSGVITVQMEKFLSILAILCGLGYAVFNSSNKKSVQYPHVAYIVLLGGMVVSIFMASVIHQQGLITSAVAVSSYLFPYLCFIIFINLGVSRQRILNTLIVLSFLSSIVYAANISTAPHFVFGRPLEDLDLSRGMLRISIVFLELFPLLLFYSINQWFETRKAKWMAYAAFLMLMIFLSVTRQVIFVSAVLALYSCLRKVKLSSKIAVILFTLFVGVYVLPKIPVYKTMLALSEAQKEDNEDKEDIRITAWRFYTYEGQTDEICFLLGNGVPSFGKSEWGDSFDHETDNNKCYAVDVGWAVLFLLWGSSLHWRSFG